MASKQCYLKQQFQNISSTKITLLSPIIIDEHRTWTNLVLSKPITITGQISTNQTGRLPIPSSLGTKYFMICYNYDFNAIITISLKPREGSELIWVYKALNNYLTDRGLKPQIQRLDNDASLNLKKIWLNYKLNINCSSKFTSSQPCWASNSNLERPLYSRIEYYIQTISYESCM